MTKKDGRILIVDDSKSILKALHFILDPVFELVRSVNSPNQISHILDKEDFDVILLDMNFSAGISTGNEGLYWLNRLLKSDPEAVVVLITAYGDIELAVKTIRKGAFDFVVKPWDNQKLISTLKAGLRLRKSRLELGILKDREKIFKSDSFDNSVFIGASPKIQSLYSDINKLAKADANVLIIGENGTGKELIAKRIHQASSRKNDIFLTVDMASLNESLFESELFGHVKGAFTDARENKTGKFKAASGGTLFLDEIGNLPLSLQAKLLQVLQNHKISPVGSNKEIDIDIRLISATNKDLKDMVDKQVFREDLYYRINTIILEVPPLRERDDDINKLGEFFLKKYSSKYGKPELKFNISAIESINKYSWPGNVRELMHAIEKSVILCDADNISSDDLGLSEMKYNDFDTKSAKSLEEIERLAIIEALKRNNWNISSTANELNIIRQTLYRKMKKYDI